MNDKINTETVLHLVKEVFEASLSPREFASMSFDVKEHLGQYVLRIQREMLGEKVQKDVTVLFAYKTPKTWWDHFKQENFPAWMLRRFPVKYVLHTEQQKIRFDRTFVFPNAYQEGHHTLGKFIIRDHHRIKDEKAN